MGGIVPGVTAPAGRGVAASAFAGRVGEGSNEGGDVGRAADGEDRPTAPRSPTPTPSAAATRIPPAASHSHSFPPRTGRASTVAAGVTVFWAGRLAAAAGGRACGGRARLACASRKRQQLVGRGREVDRAAQGHERPPEVVSHLACRRIAVLTPPCERALEHGLQLGPAGSARQDRKVRRLVEDLVERGHHRVGADRLLTGDQLVEDEADREEIAAAVELSRADLLGRHVVRGADDRAARGGAETGEAGDAEVHDLRRPPVGQEHVRRLHVAVDDAVLVRVAESPQHLQDERQRRPRIRPNAGADRLGEVDALQQLERHERSAFVFPELVDDHDVRVGQPRGGLGLPKETRPRLAIGDAVRHHLERHLAIEAVVVGSVDRAHRSPAELAGHAIAADPIGRGHGRNDTLRPCERSCSE